MPDGGLALRGDPAGGRGQLLLQLPELAGELGVPVTVKRGQRLLQTGDRSAASGSS